MRFMLIYMQLVTHSDLSHQLNSVSLKAKVRMKKKSTLRVKEGLPFRPQVTQFNQESTICPYLVGIFTCCLLFKYSQHSFGLAISLVFL